MNPTREELKDAKITHEIERKKDRKGEQQAALIFTALFIIAFLAFLYFGYTGGTIEATFNGDTGAFLSDIFIEFLVALTEIFYSS